MKIVMSTKTGKAYQADVPQDKVSAFLGLKIKDEIDGGLVGAAGYKLKITGGSDISGFPIREDVSGSRRMKVLLSEPPGFNPTLRGERARRTVHGNQVDLEIAQLNTIVIADGPQPLEELFKKKEGEKKEEKKAQPKKKSLPKKK